MTLQESVDFIEKSAMLRILGPIGDEAWQTLKAAALAQQTHNSAMMPCCEHFQCDTVTGMMNCGHPDRIKWYAQHQ